MYTFINGSSADADEVNENFDELLSLATYQFSGSYQPVIDLTITSDTITLDRGKFYRFNSLSVTSGSILVGSDNYDKPLILYTENDMTLTSGLMDLARKGMPGGAAPGKKNDGIGGSAYTYFSYGSGSGAGGDNGNYEALANGGAAGSLTYFSGSSIPSNIQTCLNIIPAAGGGSGGGGLSSSSGGNGGAGGAGGGTVVLISRGNMTLGNSFTIDVSGADGSDGQDHTSTNGGGGGGGGGGAGGTIIACYNGTLSDNATKILNGGAGGAGGAYDYPVGYSGAGGGGASGAGSVGSDGASVSPDSTGGEGGYGGSGLYTSFSWH